MPQLLIDDLPVEVVRKNIRTLRLSVHMPDGRVRVAVPLRTPEATIRELVVARRAWIEKHQARFAAREVAPALTYVSGELHPYQGQACVLQVHEAEGTPKVVLLPNAEPPTLTLHIRADSTVEQRRKALDGWYRQRLREQLPALLATWQPVVGAQASSWGIKQMKTRWGTCNIQARRVWLNLELIKRPLPCLEYVVVHELTHLHERYHNARFWGFMDQFMPDWRQHKAELNRVHLRAADAD
ncbi:M48 family metallopeptidase [Hymenobacter canadensis]|uniref:SprT family zinc-dependent metalloprotease n=1 Tax=Hymenobacter canadensis TaxID=2999067 RepID=A0ABY7LU71_9BACT|nr:SprT family zinc-dependent metalloprotease [Hymenobacter canadensis]WBA43409.1 SprT family zinc-dependent metalloprotease [Hymenobacter canadensis]